MMFQKFTQRINQTSEKKLFVLIILLSCVFAAASILYHQGGCLLPEMYVRLPYYMSDRPLINMVFDTRDLDVYRARELSYLFDIIDSKFIRFSVENGFPHFLSLTHYIFSVLIGCIIWLFCIRQLKFSPLTGLGFFVLFWTSSDVFLGGDMFRSAKVGVALLGSVLYYLIYKITTLSIAANNFKIPSKTLLFYCITVFSITYFDEQGLFMALTAFVFWAIWALAFRNKKIYIILIFTISNILLHLVYRYGIAPRLTLLLNGYWPDMSYKQFPLKDILPEFLPLLAMGMFLYTETFRMLLGGIPLWGGTLLLLFIVFLSFSRLYTCPQSIQKKRIFLLVFIELLITNLLLVILMYGLMAFTHPPLTWPGDKLLYYWFPTSVMFMMTLAVLMKFSYNLQAPNWIASLILVVVVLSNIVALPKYYYEVTHGDLEMYYQASPALLRALKKNALVDEFHDPSVEENPVYLFFNPEFTLPDE